MSSTPVIAYATQRPLRQGLRLVTILVIVALLQGARDIPVGIEQILTTWRISRHIAQSGQWTPGILDWSYQCLRLAAALAIGVSALLLFVRPNLGIWLYVGASVAQSVVMPLVGLAMLLSGTGWAKLSLGHKTAVISADLLYLIAAIMLVWLLWAVASNARPGTLPDVIPWPKLRKTTLTYMLGLGTCSLLAILITIFQAYAERGTLGDYSSWAHPCAAVLLIVAAAWALASGRCGWLCAAAAAAWLAYPVVEAALWAVVVCDGPIGQISRWLNIGYMQILTAELVRGTLLFLLVRHPRIIGITTG